MNVAAHVVAVALVATVVVLVVGCVGGCAWFRYRHPFWAGRPGPHWHHVALAAIGLQSPGIIRPGAAPAPLPHMVWATPRPASVACLPEYVELLNNAFALGEDYRHTYTVDALAARLFAPGAITLDVVTPAGCVVGLVSSRRVKATRTGVFSSVFAGHRVGIGIIDFLCVARDARGAGLANHLIAWMDTIASQQGRAVHLFEREGVPAPIPAVGVTTYRYAERIQPQRVDAQHNSVKKQPEDIVKDIMNNGVGWDLVSEDDVARWSTASSDVWVMDVSGVGSWIVENAYMTDSHKKKFGIVVAVVPATGQSMAAVADYMLSHSPWDYLLASDDVLPVADGDAQWKPSSRAWTHVYNCILPNGAHTPGLRVLAM